MVRMAGVGTSFITEWFIEAARQSGVVDVVAVYSRDAERAARFAASQGIERGVSDWDALLADDTIDALHVGSPNVTHAAQVKAALAAGKHVLCEKPLTTSHAESAELIALARERGLVLLEAMRSTYDPGMARVRELVAGLGTVRRASLRMCQYSSRYGRVLAGEQVNVFDPAMGGGALFDLGCYVAHPLVGLFGEPERVLAAEVKVATGADGTGTILAVYPTMVAELVYSKITHSSTPSEIQGELGTLVIDSITAPRHLVVERVDGSRHVEDVEGPEMNLVYEVRRFADLVASGGSAEAEQDVSLMAARLLDAARAQTVRE